MQIYSAGEKNLEIEKVYWREKGTENKTILLSDKTYEGNITGNPGEGKRKDTLREKQKMERRRLSKMKKTKYDVAQDTLLTKAGGNTQNWKMLCRGNVPDGKIF